MKKLATSHDAFLGGRLHITQPTNGHRSGHEAVLLAAALGGEANLRICELGAGVGVASLCAAHRLPDARLCGVESLAPLVALARRNAAENNLAARVDFTHADILAPFAEWGLPAASFDRIIANPPFYDSGCVSPLADAGKQRAHQTGALSGAQFLAVWIKRASALAAAKAQIILIHRAAALPDILAAMAGRLGDVQVLPIQPRPDTPAHRIIIRGTRDRRGALQILPPFILADAAGAPSEAAEAVLRHGAALAFTPAQG